MIDCVEGQPTVKIGHKNGRVQTVHINRLRLHAFRSSPPSPPSSTPPTSSISAPWQAPQIEHIIVDREPSPEVERYSHPQHDRRPPDKYGF